MHACSTGIVGQLAVGTQPHVLRGRRVALPADRVAVDVAMSIGRGRSYHSPSCSAYGAIRVLKSARSSGRPIPCGIVIWWSGPGSCIVEAGLQVEDRLAVLDRHDAAGGEAAAVADAVDLVEDRHGRVAGPQEVGVQRVHEPAAFVDRAGGGDERLAGHLAAEHALAVLVG